MCETSLVKFVIRILAFETLGKVNIYAVLIQRLSVRALAAAVFPSLALAVLTKRATFE